MRLPPRSLVPLFVLLAGSLLWSACKQRGSGDSAVLDATGSGTTYTGHSDYRLVFAQNPGVNFNPNVDVTKANGGDVGAKLYDSMRSAALKSLIPVMGIVTGNKTGSEADLLPAVSDMVMHAAATLREEIRPVLQTDASNLPAVSEAFLVPWLEEKSDLFYDQEKISMDAVEVANVLKAMPGSEAFGKKLTDDIKALQKKLYASSPDPWFLLGARHLLFVAPGKSRLTVRVLVGLKATEVPFTKTDDRVKFSKMTVPDRQERGVVASLLFDADLEAPNATPKLTVEFGDFDSYAKGNFTVDAATQAKFAPRLEGQANKTGTSWIALNFNFQKVTIDMRTAQVSDISTLLSPGLRVSGSNWVVGGLRVQSIDQSFQTEINNTIDAQLRTALDQANDKILDGMMSKEIMESAFNTIFGRGRAS